MRTQQTNLRRSVAPHINKVVQADQLVMLDWFSNPSCVSRNVLEEMRLGINPKQPARISLVAMTST